MIRRNVQTTSIQLYGNSVMCTTAILVACLVWVIHTYFICLLIYLVDKSNFEMARRLINTTNGYWIGCMPNSTNWDMPRLEVYNKRIRSEYQHSYTSVILLFLENSTANLLLLCAFISRMIRYDRDWSSELYNCFPQNRFYKGIYEVELCS